MSACDPLIQAERRCNAHCLNRSRWDLFPCRGPVVPCRTLSPVSATCHGAVKPRVARPGVSEKGAQAPLLAQTYVPKSAAQAGVPVPQSQSCTIISELLLACSG